MAEPLPAAVPASSSHSTVAPELIPLPLSPSAIDEASAPRTAPSDSSVDSASVRDPILEGDLEDIEKPWATRHDFLKERGYWLRPRYRPGWKASWTTYDEQELAEDALVMARPHLLDAIRLSDNMPVYLKLVKKPSAEIVIGRFLLTGNLPKDPRNHSVPLLDVLEDANTQEDAILVFPLLRRLDSPGPASIRECVSLVEQTLEGLAFLHEHSVAHRDCAWGNIMMDARAMFPAGWHPQNPMRDSKGRPIKNTSPSRTAFGGVRYFFIDFGISTLGENQTVGFSGQQRAPELSYDVPYNPYKLDVYVLGMAYKQFLVDRNSGADFVKPLIAYMTPQAPEDRPSAAEVVERFKLIRSTMTESQLSQRLWPLKPEWIGIRMVKDVYYRLCDQRWTKKPKKELEPFV